jgi:superfamily II DNA or RNA helicase
MKLVKLAGPRWGIQSEYNVALLRACKTTPGCRWDPVQGMWTAYADAIACVEAKLEKEGLKLERAPGAPATATESFIECPDSPRLGLRSYQKQSLLAAVTGAKEGHIVALEMGLGKTAVASAAIQAWEVATAVVCPAYVRSIWSDELAKWAPHLRVFHCRGTKRPVGAIPVFDVAVVNQDVLFAWLPFLQANCAALIIDEIHMYVDANSRRSKAAKSLAESCEYRLGLTGTPVTGRLKALWNMADILSPGRFGSFFSYAKRFCNAQQTTITTRADGPKVVWSFDGRSNEEELATRLKFFMFRRTRKEVALELPQKTRQVIRVDCDKQKVDFSALQLTPTVLRQLLQAAADTKMPEVMRIVADHAEAGHNVVVFTHRKAVAEAVADAMSAAGIASGVIHSDVTEKARAALMAAPPAVLCCTIDSVVTGISLAFADVGVFAELSYEAWKLQQAEARLHRQGQLRNVLIQYIVGAGSVEDMVLDKILDKLDTEAMTVGSSNTSLAGDLRGAQQSEADAFADIFAKLGG